MRTKIAPFGIALLLAGCATMSPNSTPAAAMLDAMIGEEAAFMADTRTIGLMPAFAERAADDAVMFLPGPTLIKPRLATEKWPGEVSWSPAFVTAARDGSLGASIGPSSWVVRGKASPGYYFTIWERQGDRSLKFVFDGSADMPRDLYASRPTSAERLIPTEGEDRPHGGEESLGKAIAAGRVADYLDAIHPRGRVLRDGHHPAIGPAGAVGLIAIVPGERHRTREAHSAPSGDLIWTYGDITLGRPEPVAHFVRVWVRDSEGWRIAIDFRKDL